MKIFKQEEFRLSYQQKTILSKLFYWNCKFDKFREYYSDKQSLYLSLRTLIKHGLIEKINYEYRITQKGKDYLTNNKITPIL
jgi:DNA-binding HxlR family transcriptional regulator